MVETWGSLNMYRREFGYTVFTLSIGILSIILLISISNTFREEIENITFGVMGRAISITENTFIRDRYGPPNISDAGYLSDRLEGIEDIIGWKNEPATVLYNTVHAEGILYGVYGNYIAEVGATMALGRNFAENDFSSTSAVCVLGHKLAINFNQNETMPGKTIYLNGSPCTVIGVLEKPGSFAASKYADAVFVPLVSLERRYSTDDRTNFGELNSITVILSSDKKMQSVEMNADTLLRARHGIPQSNAPAYRYNDGSMSRENIMQQRKLTSTLLICTSSISFILALFSYVTLYRSLMFTRFKEFCIRSLNGAGTYHLVGQTILETLFVNLASILLAGVLLSAILTMMNRLSFLEFGFNWPQLMLTAVALMLICLAFNLSVVLGVVKRPLSDILKS